MIADLDETIRQLLIAELPIKNGEIDVSFDQPKREWSARLSKPAVNFFLYDMRENATLRQHQWERMPAKWAIAWPTSSARHSAWTAFTCSPPGLQNPMTSTAC
jgi:hypothetical protein